jgi:hypothetical protein
MWLGSTFAVLNGHFELAAYLLSKDANPNAFGVGYTPLPAAVLRGTERNCASRKTHRRLLRGDDAERHDQVTAGATARLTGG